MVWHTLQTYTKIWSFISLWFWHTLQTYTKIRSFISLVVTIYQNSIINKLNSWQKSLAWSINKIKRKSALFGKKVKRWRKPSPSCMCNVNETPHTSYREQKYHCWNLWLHSKAVWNKFRRIRRFWLRFIQLRGCKFGLLIPCWASNNKINWHFCWAWQTGHRMIQNSPKQIKKCT
jgi:hypothetical protein